MPRHRTAQKAKPRFKATLTAVTHAPKVNSKWYYSVRVVDLRRRPLEARITVVIVDPFSGVHPVQYSYSNKNIVNHKIRGTFTDWATWPPESAGFPLSFRVKVKTAQKGSTTLKYIVRPKA
jgi:hypothetical protein